MAGSAGLPACACRKAAIVTAAPEPGSWICARACAGPVTCSWLTGSSGAMCRLWACAAAVAARYARLVTLLAACASPACANAAAARLSRSCRTMSAPHPRRDPQPRVAVELGQPRRPLPGGGDVRLHRPVQRKRQIRAPAADPAGDGLGSVSGTAGATAPLKRSTEGSGSCCRPRPPRRPRTRTGQVKRTGLLPGRQPGAGSTARISCASDSKSPPWRRW